MKKSRNRYIKYGLIFGLTLALSLVLGFIFSDYYFLGCATLFLGFTQTLLLSKGKWWEEVVGIAEAIFVATVAWIAHLYGTVIFTMLIYIPMSIFSMINWKKHQYNGVVHINKMTIKASLFIVFSLCCSVVLVSFGLSKIPNQNLPIMDTISNLMDICGLILIALRFKEGWIFWILCSTIDFIMWAVLLSQGESMNAIMMVIVSAVNIAINCWGFYSFVKLRKKQEIKQIKSRAMFDNHYKSLI